MKLLTIFLTALTLFLPTYSFAGQGSGWGKIIELNINKHGRLMIRFSKKLSTQITASEVISILLKRVIPMLQTVFIQQSWPLMQQIKTYSFGLVDVQRISIGDIQDQHPMTFT